MARSLKRAFNVRDNYQTPAILVNVLKPFLADYSGRIGKKPLIWCPFDTNESEYVKKLTEWGYDVQYSDIINGQDFFHEISLRKFDIVISNPPFSKKLHIFKKLIELNKPFALLTNLMCINYQEIGGLFVTEEAGNIQLIIPDKKVSFDGNTSSFCSGYVCRNFIDKTSFVHLAHNNANKYFKDNK